MTEPNTAELVAVYQYIKANPDDWAQWVWGQRTDCGTRFCLAGSACILAGATPIWEPDLMPDENGLNASWDLVGFDFNGKERETVTLAEEILGLTEPQSEALFWGSNNLAEIRRIIIQLTGQDPDPAEVTS